jgi:hypothetical protein
MTNKPRSTGLLTASALFLAAFAVALLLEQRAEDPARPLDPAALASLTGLNPSYRGVAGDRICSIANGGTAGNPPIAAHYCPGSPYVTCITCKAVPPALVATSSDGLDPNGGLEPAGSTLPCNGFEKWLGICRPEDYVCVAAVSLGQCAGEYNTFIDQNIIIGLLPSDANGRPSVFK